MSHKDSFGLRLRAARERQGVTLQSIARSTKVSVSLWRDMESNDFSKWPSGLFARSYVRDYARLVGLDPEEVVDEFCRHFPNGDRRRGNLVRAQAEVIDIRSAYHDDQMPPEGDRREAPGEPQLKPWTFPGGVKGQRVAGALADALVVFTAAIVVGQLVNGAFLAALAVIAVAYSAAATAIIGRSPGLALAQLLGRRVPQLLPVPERRMQA
jgi:transcriptional regulator with XRE-family HTH domain